MGKNPESSVNTPLYHLQITIKSLSAGQWGIQVEKSRGSKPTRLVAMAKLPLDD